MAAFGCAAAIAIPSIALGNARSNQLGAQTPMTPLVTRMTGAAEVPGPGDPDGFGGASVTFDLSVPGSEDMCWDLTYGNLTGTPLLAHIHGPAVAGASASPVLGFTTSTLGATSASGCRALTGPEAIIAADVVANPVNYYVNVHTSDFGNGAIRGQLATAPAPAGEAHLLPAPLRAYDSRDVDGPIALNATRTISLATGKDSATPPNSVLAVPPGATGAIVTLTLTDTSIANGPGGFLKLYSAALGTPPSTSSINWTGAGQNLAVTTQVAVDASGQVKITDGANPTNFVVDVIGYLF
jgi:hypothetical protein